jgi:RimJ/RimL family protein N-acetyltransferase
MAEINSNPNVMEFFPSIPNFKQTEAFIERMQKQFSDHEFCYFAVDTLANNEFIGFIGISHQTFQSNYTPSIDIGWRLSQAAWGKGFATEGAKRCLEFAFNTIGLKKIIAICPVINDKSERVMKKLGMTKKANFNHPLLTEYEHLEKCVVYEIVST